MIPGKPINKLIAKLLYGVVVAEVIIGLALGFAAYFVRSFDRQTGLYFDGLGRQLYLAPFLARFVFGADSLWPGWVFFLVDIAVFWGGIGIGYVLVNLAARLESNQTASQETSPSRPFPMKPGQG
ncbi:MAG: hypothetical protein HY646_07355 [Acidobacteria bacterium]|nr:hypothetical protein [Acidobacteriota bacterium]